MTKQFAGGTVGRVGAVVALFSGLLAGACSSSPITTSGHAGAGGAAAGSHGTAGTTGSAGVGGGAGDGATAGSVGAGLDQMVGTQGGTISRGDFKLTIPADALSTDTPISVM